MASARTRLSGQHRASTPAGVFSVWGIHLAVSGVVTIRSVRPYGKPGTALPGNEAPEPDADSEGAVHHTWIRERYEAPVPGGGGLDVESPE
jgi:hypothetical protein